MSTSNPFASNVKAVNPMSPPVTLDLNPDAGPDKEQELPKAEAGPGGTIKEILDWVGNDRGRAATVASAEKKADHPRPTLLAKLEKVLSK